MSREDVGTSHSSAWMATGAMLAAGEVASAPVNPPAAPRRLRQSSFGSPPASPAIGEVRSTTRSGGCCDSIADQVHAPAYRVATYAGSVTIANAFRIGWRRTLS